MPEDLPTTDEAQATPDGHLTSHEEMPSGAPAEPSAHETEPPTELAHEASAAPEPAAEPAAQAEAHREESEAAPHGEDGHAANGAGEAAVAEEAPAPSKKNWYVVKVQSGREESIKEAIERRVKKEGLEEFFGQIVIPVEKVTEMRNNKKGERVRVVKERKLYPGYLMVEVEYNDRILYLFRETSGVGDFVGATINRPPQPMSQREIDRITVPAGGPEKVGVPTKPKWGVGDRVRVRDGTFAGMEGEVKEILEALGHVKVELTIFGRPVSVELEYWQVEPV